MAVLPGDERSGVRRGLGRLSALLPVRADVEAVRRAPGRDLIAGLTVAVVALPLALAFGAASGLGPEAGLATAVVAGIVAAVFGGSNVQVSGPTGAMTVVLLPVVAVHGPGGVLMVGLMAGLFLIGMSLLRLGRYVRFLPVSVLEGFTAGIAVVIALQQLPVALGVEAEEGSEKVWAVAFDAVVQFAHEPHAAPVGLASGVAALMLWGGRWRPRLPFSLIGLAAASGATSVLDLDVVVLGPLPSTLPAPSLGFVDAGALGVLVTSALAIAALAALESLLCATVADAMTVDEHHDPDRELFGQGLANMVTPLFGGVPATAAIARTAVNVRAGARSRLAAITHSLTLLAMVLVAGPLVSALPLAALAGVLFATCVRMVETGALRALLRSTRSDAAIVVLTFGVTVAVDLVVAVGVGVAVAVVLALRTVARSANIEQVPLAEEDGQDTQGHALLGEHIVVYRIDGPLFFGAAHRLLELPDVFDVDAIVLRMSRVTSIDATGARMLADTVARLERRNVIVLLSGLQPGHEDVMEALGDVETMRSEGRILHDTPTAIARARQLLQDAGRAAPVTSPDTAAGADGP
ncbi:MAG: dauA 2 [Nocardioides sp.]|nr:dauA 2 [Nocardioides sp.]